MEFGERVVHEEHDAGRYTMVFDASGYEKSFETKMKRLIDLVFSGVLILSRRMPRQSRSTCFHQVG